MPYPQSTFEALLVKTVNWGDDLEELVDALLVVEVGKLLEGLLDLLPQSLCLETMTTERERGTKGFGDVQTSGKQVPRRRRGTLRVDRH